MFFRLFLEINFIEKELFGCLLEHFYGVTFYANIVLDLVAFKKKVMV